MIDLRHTSRHDSAPLASEAETPKASPVTPDLRSRYHPACFVCGTERPHGLGLQFRLQSDGSVAATCAFDRIHEGYPGVVHGGIVAAALDGAMTNWLFCHNHSAVTAELKVRYLLPVASRTPALILARRTEGSGMLHVMTAELQQGGRQMASATAKFVVNAASARITEVGA